MDLLDCPFCGSPGTMNQMALVSCSNQGCFASRLYTSKWNWNTRASDTKTAHMAELFTTLADGLNINREIYPKHLALHALEVIAGKQLQIDRMTNLAKRLIHAHKQRAAYAPELLQDVHAAGLGGA